MRRRKNLEEPSSSESTCTAFERIIGKVTFRMRRSLDGTWLLDGTSWRGASHATRDEAEEWLNEHGPAFVEWVERANRR